MCLTRPDKNRMGSGCQSSPFEQGKVAKNDSFVLYSIRPWIWHATTLRKCYPFSRKTLIVVIFGMTWRAARRLRSSVFATLANKIVALLYVCRIPHSTIIHKIKQFLRKCNITRSSTKLSHLEQEF